jgi:ABC-type Na+ transport system ATPase subunit NatA
VIIIGGGRVRFAGSLDALRAATASDDLEDAFMRVVGEPAP